MTRFISHLLIFLVLFTQNTMAIDVHVPLKIDHSIEQSIDSADSHELLSDEALAIVFDQSACLDVGGHCSHSQAHAAGLISINDLFALNIKPVLFTVSNASLFIQTQSPPLRPPKHLI